MLLASIAWSCAPALGSETQSHESIGHAVEAFLLAQKPQPDTKARVSVTELDRRLQLPRCSAELETFFPPGSQRAGSITVGVRCAGARPWTVYVPARLELYTAVVVAKRPLPRGTRIESADLVLAERAIHELRRGYVAAIDDVVGKVLQRPIGIGTPFTPDVLKSPLLVRRGESVVIVAEAAGLDVRVPGIALSDGSAGAQIRVRNVLSKKIVDATVTDEGTVNVRM